MEYIVRYRSGNYDLHYTNTTNGFKAQIAPLWNCWKTQFVPNENELPYVREEMERKKKDCELFEYNIYEVHTTLFYSSEGGDYN